MSTSGMDKNLLALNGKLALTTGKLIATKVAAIGLQVALSAGLSLGITALISGFAKLVDNLVNAKANLKEFNDEYNNTMASGGKQFDSSKAQTLLNTYEKLQKQLSD